MDTQHTLPSPRRALYLRADGTLLFVRDDHCIELRLTPGQLLQLGIDCLAVATDRAPELMPTAAAALSECVVPPELVDAAAVAVSESAIFPVESLSCPKH